MVVKRLSAEGNFYNVIGCRRRHHEDNIQFLDKNICLKEAIFRSLDPILGEFFANAGKQFLNSAEIATSVCSNLSLPHTEFHHGLVGSLLLEMLKAANPTNFGLLESVELIADKEPEEHFAVYFFNIESGI